MLLYCFLHSLRPLVLVSQDLLDHVTRGYSELSIRTQSSTPVSSHSSSQRYKPDTPNLSLGGVLFNEAPGRSPSPPSHHRRSEPDLSMWGGGDPRGSGNPLERSTSTGDSHEFHRRRMIDNAPLVRSQSAAPAVVGPPPGIPADMMPNRPSSSFTGTTSWELTRGDEPTVRPAAKTLMELIQEDVPPPATLLQPPNRQDLLQHRGQIQQENTFVPGLDAHSYNAPSQDQQQQPINAYFPQPQQQQHFQQFQRQQQNQQHAVLYNPGVQQQQQQRHDVSGLRVQTLSGNPQVFVNTTPQQGFGYSTVHFPSTSQGGQQQQQQYVSVMSVPGGAGQQVSYYSAPSPQEQGGFHGGSGGVPHHHHHSHHLDSSPMSPASSHYRRERSGGRGRRGGPRGRVDSKGSTSSLLLEEFRSSKSRDWTIRRIEGHISEFCQDQNGSRFIQQRLEMGDIMEQQLVMKEVLPSIRILRTDVFGNYVVQKLLDFGTHKMKQEIKVTLEGEMLQLSLQMYGCRVVQKALETLDEDDLPRLLREFHHNVLNCIHDQNGNHVIQKCIEVLYTRARKATDIGDSHRAHFLNEQVDFIIEDVLVNTTSLSCHPYGCRVLQRMLEHCPEQRKMQVLDEIKLCHKTLLDDQYGNYVIQHVLQYGREEDRDSLLRIIAEHGLLRLSRQKFASNVVEKLLKYGNGNQRRGIVREMLKVCTQDCFQCSSVLICRDTSTTTISIADHRRSGNARVPTTQTS